MALAPTAEAIELATSLAPKFQAMENPNANPPIRKNNECSMLELAFSII